MSDIAEDFLYYQTDPESMGDTGKFYYIGYDVDDKTYYLMYFDGDVHEDGGLHAIPGVPERIETLEELRRICEDQGFPPEECDETAFEELQNWVEEMAEED